MEKIKNIFYNHRSLIVQIGFLLIFIFLGTRAFQYRTEKINTSRNIVLTNILEKIGVFVNLHSINNQDNLFKAQQVINFIFLQNEEVKVLDSTIIITAIHPKTMNRREAEVQLWEKDNKIIQNNLAFISYLNQLDIDIVKIFQRFDNGYVNISSNINHRKNENIIEKYISNDNEIVKSISRNEVYQKKDFILDEWYNGLYIPIEIDNEIQAIVYIGMKLFDYKLVKNFFEKNTDLSDTYPFLLNERGDVLIHPSIEKQNISTVSFFKKIIFSNKKNGNFEYVFPENKLGKNKFLYYKYIPNLEAYLCLTSLQETIEKEKVEVLYIISFIIFIIFILFQVAYRLVYFPLRNGINKFGSMFENIYNGKLESYENAYYSNEFKNIFKTLNLLVKDLKTKIEFAQEIQKGNFYHHFKFSNKGDLLANTLLKIRDDLKTTKDEEDKRKKEDKIRNWITEGQTKFSDILRLDNNNLKVLGENIIIYVVKYMNANQGGLFMINDNDKINAFIEQISCFAYNRKRRQKQTIEFGDGLIGRCVDEKETIYMTEIPDDYVNITSGLGDGNPRSLLIVPLKLNEDVFGVIELAFFEKLEQYKIDLVEKLANSIASTLSTAKVNEKTALLLEQATEQAEILASQDEEMRQNLEEMQTTQEEAARKESEARGFVDAINHTLIHCDIDLSGNVIYANSLFLDILDYSSYELRNKHYSIFVANENKYKVKNILDSVIKGGNHFEGFIKHQKKDDTTKRLWTMITAVKDREGKIKQILYIAIDIQ